MNGLDDLFQRLGRRTGQADGGQVIFVQGDLAFVLFQIGAAFADQAAGVDEDLALADFGLSQALGQQRGAQQPANADARGARADQQEPLLAQGLPGDAQARRGCRPE